MQNILLTPEEFDAHLADGTLRLSFVGMSNSGKSYRSRVLAADSGFFWYQVDGDIQKTLGFKDQDEISAWLGYPSSEHYAKRERRYLELENEFTGSAAMSARGKNLVFDTTGSVVHLADETLRTLRDNTLVVHLDVGNDSMDDLLTRFFRDPKPVAWSGFFRMEESEPVEEALRRSYPALLTERLARYRALAHLNIGASEMHDKTGAETLALIRGKLKTGVV
ncbi:MAG: hypothetical protein WC814_01150 [Candidatus Paceibacterota bacterium]|jgi:shikimate kinase